MKQLVLAKGMRVKLIRETSSSKSMGFKLNLSYAISQDADGTLFIRNGNEIAVLADSKGRLSEWSDHVKVDKSEVELPCGLFHVS